jgi:tetratricopeptide (TPR) repeat protein
MRKHAYWLTGLLLLAGCATTSHAVPGKSEPTQAADASLPPSAQSDLYLGVVDGLIRQQRYEAAIAFLAQYQKSQAPTPRYHKLVGDALAGAGRTEEALAAYRLALKSDFAAQAYNGIGRTLSVSGKWEEAAANFRQAATLDPSNAGYLNNFGYAQLKQNFRGSELAPVVNELERAHELDPSSILIRDNLALALALAGDHDRFIAFLNTITDAGGRQRIADFAVKWNPGWTGDTGIEKETP